MSSTTTYTIDNEHTIKKTETIPQSDGSTTTVEETFKTNPIDSRYFIILSEIPYSERDDLMDRIIKNDALLGLKQEYAKFLVGNASPDPETDPYGLVPGIFFFLSTLLIKYENVDLEMASCPEIRDDIYTIYLSGRKDSSPITIRIVRAFHFFVRLVLSILFVPLTPIVMLWYFLKNLLGRFRSDYGPRLRGKQEIDLPTKKEIENPRPLPEQPNDEV